MIKNFFKFCFLFLSFQIFSQNIDQIRSVSNFSSDSELYSYVEKAKLRGLSLIEVEDKVDTGDIWKKKKVNIPKTALFEEINHIVFGAEIELMDFAIENFSRVTPLKQIKEEASYWKKRTPKDSELNIYMSLDEQFDLIRVSDVDRFPAYFFKNGEKFLLSLKKIK